MRELEDYDCIPEVDIAHPKVSPIGSFYKARCSSQIVGFFLWMKVSVVTQEMAERVVLRDVYPDMPWYIYHSSESYNGVLVYKKCFNDRGYGAGEHKKFVEVLPLRGKGQHKNKQKCTHIIHKKPLAAENTRLPRQCETKKSVGNNKWECGEIAVAQTHLNKVKDIF